MHGEGPKRMRLSAQGPGEVTAGQIDTGHDIEVMNPDLVICTLDKGAKLSMELTVDTGKGYVPSMQNRPEDAPIGLIPVDSRSEEHTSELQSLMRISYAVFCLKKKKHDASY